MAKQILVQCNGCEFYCYPKPIAYEQLSTLIKINPQIANQIFYLETVVLVCPCDGQTLYAKLG